MTKTEQITAWMEEKPVVWMAVNGELVELTGDDRIPFFEQAAADLEAARPAMEAANLNAIKAAAGAVILDRLPAWRQANLTARALELSDAKHTRELTESELGEQSAIAAAWAWVRAVRAHSDALESLAASGETVDLAAVEWPAP
jgi:hypothetical protein